METRLLFYLQLTFVLLYSWNYSFAQNEAIVSFEFENTLESGRYQLAGDGYSFSGGLEGQALSLCNQPGFEGLRLNGISLNHDKDFTVQFWIKTQSEKPTVFLSQKEFTNKSIVAQKNAGWVMYTSGGTFAWAAGSGDRRLNYEHDNGEKMPVNDGKWHQLTMTYNSVLREVRLFYDGKNKAIYKLGFDFGNDEPFTIGTKTVDFYDTNTYAPDIIKGKAQLQALVDAFNDLDTENLEDDEFIPLIADPKELYINKLNLDSADAQRMDDSELEILHKVFKARKPLSANAYTVFQNRKLTEIKPIHKIYFLQNGEVGVNEKVARVFSEKELLYPSDFFMDNLSVWDRVLGADEVWSGYIQYKPTKSNDTEEKLKSLTVAVWNIWHGGKHFVPEKDGWDSRIRIADMIREMDADIVLMQETYSSGDFIAAELDYYFATTSDWDYCQQGSNISVLSRYPILEVAVPPDAEFMNVCARIALSENQEIYALSNWFGMSKFSVVYNYQKDKFDGTDTIPVLFGGDFNAVPHTDGGDSPASKQLMDVGFTDAYRSLFQNVEEYPGHTHIGGYRIDQLYYKGQGLKNGSTKVISDWPGGFPSDHFLIIGEFELNH